MKVVKCNSCKAEIEKNSVGYFYLGDVFCSEDCLNEAYSIDYVTEQITDEVIEDFGVLVEGESEPEVSSCNRCGSTENLANYCGLCFCNNCAILIRLALKYS